ncbi:hypothetical protein D9613_004366 [Agrocybe pediades]|uniref:Uncharacterized protein n=1 Tax=Agrocybe pediades TaxID=84607 RepID=A0A8H4QIU7_9AGAR|nr:hypothetical protein D9613_004366 [Agrocybe pediades]
MPCRASQHIRILLDTISQFPRVNPSASEGAGADLDISKLFRQIRSRYKILCSSLGVRPRLSSSSEASAALLDGAGPSADMDVDDEDDEKREASSSTASRVTPLRSSIPVWKIDSSGVKKPVTNEDLNF